MPGRPAAMRAAQSFVGGRATPRNKRALVRAPTRPGAQSPHRRNAYALPPAWLPDSRPSRPYLPGGGVSRRATEGAVKLTDLRTYSASWTLPKLLILRSRADRFRLQTPRILLNLTAPLELLLITLGLYRWKIRRLFASHDSRPKSALMMVSRDGRQPSAPRFKLTISATGC